MLFTTELIKNVGELPGVEEVHAPDGVPPARYNIAPTHRIPVVRAANNFAHIEPGRWGLIPHWKKDTDGPPLFNARAETVREKPSFRDAYAGTNNSGRCIIPLDGYYEWHDDGTGKQPYFVCRDDGTLMWAAGLWATGAYQLSATMLTTESVEPLSWLHGRLPRFLTQQEIPAWLAGSDSESLLEPAPQDLLQHFRTRPVDKAVGNVRNDYAELISTDTHATS